MATQTERHVKVDGIDTRYLEEGSGPAILLLHGAALGSSCDVWERQLGPLAAKGFRVIAYDRPGYGGTGDPSDSSGGYQEKFITSFMDAVGMDRAGFVGHSQTGNFAVSIGLTKPDRVSALMILGTGSLLPPLEQQAPPGAGENVFGREPTREDVREVLESQLYHHELITPELIEVRYQKSLGHVKAAPPPAAPSSGAAPVRAPLWQRLDELTMPLLLMYGKDDRGNVEARFPLFRAKYPNIELRVVDHCKHLVQIDAADAFFAASSEFFTRALK